MSEQVETQEDTGEFAGLPPAADAESAAQEATPAQDPQKNDRDYAPFIDLSDIPDEKRNAIEARFRHISGQTKREVDKVRREWQEIAAAQSEQIEKLTNGFSNVTTHLQDKSFADTETQLTQAMNTAYEAGDAKAYNDAQRKLVTLNVKREMAQAEAERNKEQPKKEVQPPAEVEAEITPEVRAWQDEVDDAGQQIRPWALPSNPGYRQAYTELLAIKNNPRMEHYNESQIMQELDRRMGMTKPTASRQQVMGGNLTRGTKPGKLSLNPKAEEIAVRMKLGGPKATREQHIQAYYKSQLEEAKQKGTRQ